jgi:hypothetical protein
MPGFLCDADLTNLASLAGFGQIGYFSLPCKTTLELTSTHLPMALQHFLVGTLGLRYKQCRTHRHAYWKV